MRKGLGLLFQAAFAVLFLSVAITIVVPRFTQPTIAAHGAKQAEIAAERLADAISAMSSMQAGIVEHNITGPWDIRIYKKNGLSYISVSYDTYSAEAKIIGSVSLDSLPNVQTVKIIKKPGEDVKVEKA